MELRTALCVQVLLCSAAAAQHFAEGVKIGEVTQNSAIVWVRLAKEPAPVPGIYKHPSTKGARAPEIEKGTDPSTLPGAVPGAPGFVRLRVDGRWTPWTAVTARSGYTHQFKVLKLRPGREYICELESAAKDGGPALAKHTATFRTPHEARTAAPVSFTVVTGLMYRDLDTPKGFRIFDAMYKDKPDFLVFTGDNVYYDNEPPRATTSAIARYHWQRMFSLPIHTKLISSLTTYWEKDDHDVLSNDSWPGMDPDWMKPMTFEIGRKIFLVEGKVAYEYRP